MWGLHALRRQPTIYPPCEIHVSYTQTSNASNQDFQSKNSILTKFKNQLFVYILQLFVYIFCFFVYILTFCLTYVSCLLTKQFAHHTVLKLLFWSKNTLKMILLFLKMVKINISKMYEASIEDCQRKFSSHRINGLVQLICQFL